MFKSIQKLLTLILLVTISSCVSKKKVLYFQNDAAAIYNNDKGFALKFKKDDMLTINVSSEDIEAVRVFNLPTVAYNAVTNTVNGIPKQQSYLIDAKGEIDFPVLGKLKIEGLTRVELIQLIKDKLDPKYVKNPTINIQILNFKINVLGDVQRPGMFQIQNERITVLDALALAGDLNISGERIVEIKRESNNGIVTGYIDLKSNKMFSSEFYYLQQNDVVYVNPNSAKLQSASYNQNTGLFISVASVLISLISILTR